LIDLSSIHGRGKLPAIIFSESGLVLCAIDATGPPVPATPRASESGVCSAERENETKSFGKTNRLVQAGRAVTLERLKGEKYLRLCFAYPVKFMTTLALRHGRHDANAFHTANATHT
jgi:hypothetical protein